MNDINPSGMIRVFLVDDHPSVLAGLRSILEVPWLEVVGQASTGKEAVREIFAVAPDVVILDVRLPDLDGREVLKRVKAGLTRAAVLMYTAFEEPSFLLDSVLEGADGFLLKLAHPSEILTTIRRLADGENCLEQCYWEPLYRKLQEKGSQQGAVGIPPGWSDRELHILQGMARGMTNAAIAEKLGLHPDTIKFHRTKIFKKTNSSGRTQAVVNAITLGIIRAPEIHPLLDSPPPSPSPFS